MYKGQSHIRTACGKLFFWGQQHSGRGVSVPLPDGCSAVPDLPEQDDRYAGEAAGCVFDPQSDTGDCRGGDGMICAKASGKVVLQVRLKQEPSVAWSVSFSIQTKISERQPESEQLSKAASDQAPAKTEKTVITKQKLPKIAITSLRSKKKGQLIIRWKKKQGIGGYEVQYGTQKTFKRAKIKKISRERQDRNHAKEDEAEEHLLCADAIVENGAGGVAYMGHGRRYVR